MFSMFIMFNMHVHACTCMHAWDTPHTPIPIPSGSVGQWVQSGHITKYQINLDLIKIIQFCLKIYDLLRHLHLWVGVWINECVNGWGQVKLNKV